MKIAKRILLFITVNILVMITINLVVSFLGLNKWMGAYGINYGQLAVFCLVWGFAGAFISLLMSKMAAKWMTGLKTISPTTSQPEERWLLDTVYRLSQKAGISKMPEVGIYDAPDMNAFATGPSKNNSLVAVSTGLLRGMNRDEVEGVLAHEVAHVANGDMVTMTLVQGVINAFVMFFSRVIAQILSQSVDEKNRGTVRFIATIVLDILLSFLGMMVVAAFSRYREFRADAGGATLGGRDKMVRALQSLKRYQNQLMGGDDALSSMKISHRRRGGLLALLSTHPDLDDRIARLQNTQVHNGDFTKMY